MSNVYIDVDVIILLEQIQECNRIAEESNRMLEQINHSLDHIERNLTHLLAVDVPPRPENRPEQNNK